MIFPPKLIHSAVEILLAGKPPDLIVRYFQHISHFHPVSGLSLRLFHGLPERFPYVRIKGEQRPVCLCGLNVFPLRLPFCRSSDYQRHRKCGAARDHLSLPCAHKQFHCSSCAAIRSLLAKIPSVSGCCKSSCSSTSWYSRCLYS